MSLRAILLLSALAASCATPTAAPTAASTIASPSEVYLQVLGVAQDAGYPQSGCYKEHCQRAWHNLAKRRAVSCLAVVDPEHSSKFLFDATPDMPEQLQMLQQLAPDADFDLDGVFLTHGHIGHYTGIMFFGREAQGSQAVPVHVMPRMSRFLAENGPWSQLVALGNIQLLALADQRATTLNSNLSVTPLLVPHRDEFTETVGFLIRGPQKTALYLPDIDKWDRWRIDIRDLLEDVDYAFLDATFFAADELPGRNMSEIPHPYVEESFALFADLPAALKAKVWFIHFNHTNPLLIEGSAAQKLVEQKGFHVARQGLRLPM